MTKRAIHIVFETHSTSEDNEAGIGTGWLPGRLSERGREQARELGRRRPPSGYDIVYASDLRRAVETADIAFGGSGLPVRHDPRLRECDYGELNGAPIAEWPQRAQFIDSPYPGGESYRQVVARVKDFLEELIQKDEPRVIVIGHSATRWALDHLLLGLRLEDLVDAPFQWREGWEYELSGTLPQGRPEDLALESPTAGD